MPGPTGSRRSSSGRALMQELRYAEHIEEEATPTQASRVR
jgi:hypothetical protein